MAWKRRFTAYRRRFSGYARRSGGKAAYWVKRKWKRIAIIAFIGGVALVAIAAAKKQGVKPIDFLKTTFSK